MTPSALFGILQLDRGEPLGFRNVPGLVQGWLQDAGGFAMVGLAIYLLYARSALTGKSESERIRVPVTPWMMTCFALGLVLFALLLALYILNANGRAALFGLPIAPPPTPAAAPGSAFVPPPPEFRTELAPLVHMVAGLVAILGLGQPFARDMVKICRRNLPSNFSGVRRLADSVSASLGGLFTPRRLVGLGAVAAAYAALGVAVYQFGTDRLFGIYTGVLIVGVTVVVLALLVLLLFEAEGPVWAIAKLSFKEAMSNKFLWIFLLVFLPFLFPAQWFRSIKPADELRVTVERTELVLTLLMLVPALLLASFSGIPNDIKNLNIYTVVSKPVEKFEIVLGRFAGYVSLMTLVLIGLTGLSLVLISNTSLSQKAREETYKARVPVYGALDFRSMVAMARTDKTEFTGTNVGREFDYRKYIAGHPMSPQRAIWHFAAVPAGMTAAADDRVPVEFTFDIFKMTKGEQNRGALVSFRFVAHHSPQKQPDKIGDWDWVDADKQRQYREWRNARPDLAAARPRTPGWAEASEAAARFGVYEVESKEVFDYQVMRVEVPGGLFRSAAAGDPGKVKVKDPVTGKETEEPAPRLSVYVKCESPGQLLGVAQADLYLLEYEQPFALNYLKGMVGLWCWLCILIGLAVVWGTYLSGVLCLVVALVLFASGFFTDHVRDLAQGRSVGGGPFESMSRVLKAEQPTAPLGDTAGAKALTALDKGAAWVFRRIQNVIPDLQSYDFGEFVSNGYNIRTEYLLVNLLVLSGYLLPWGVVGYYLMKNREVAA
ncbi:MAG: hypothetical protein C0501_25090 [Isosphaera sp.]|nr:hypothetical protein [Isosphaera sp.]